MKYIGVMKRVSISFILIAVLFSLTACQKQKYIPPNAQKYQYNYYPGTDWGMTEQEVMKSLGLKEKDVSRDGLGVEPKIRYTTAFSIEKKEYGYPATVEFYFHEMTKPQKKLTGLTLVIVRFPQNYDANKIRSYLKADLKAQGDMFIRDSEKGAFSDIIQNTYKCKGTIKQINTSIDLQVATFTLFNTYGYTGEKSGLGDWSLTNIDINESKDKKGCLIYYQGLYAAILNNTNE